MFEKLIVSSTKEPGSEGRSRYFIVSSVVVLTLFATAVVLSLYAADISIGDHEFDMSTMLAPVAAEQPEDLPPKQTTEQQSTTTHELPVVRDIIAQVADTPPSVPDAISTVRQPSLSRPLGHFIVDPNATETLGRGNAEGDSRGVSTTGTTGSSAGPDPTAVNEDAPKPPPVKMSPPPPTHPVSIGVANGRAVHLPKPPYPPHALSVGIEGEVAVQVTIDEKGNVISAKAAKGHPFLRTAAERAAINARFTPTLLSEVPVKVTGVIIYNFKRN